MLSPRGNYATAQDRRSKSLNRTLTKTKQYVQKACDQVDYNESTTEDNDEFSLALAESKSRFRRRTKSPPAYTDQLKQGLKRKVSYNKRYEQPQRSPSERIPSQRDIGRTSSKAECYLKVNERNVDNQLSSVENLTLLSNQNKPHSQHLVAKIMSPNKIIAEA